MYGRLRVLFEGNVSRQKKQSMAKEGSPEYWKQIVDAQKGTNLAAMVIEQIAKKGKEIRLNFAR